MSNVQKATLFITDTPERKQSMDWLNAEFSYAEGKWPKEQHDGITVREGTTGRWMTDIDMYLHRANVLGLGTPRGRQAAAKAMATCHTMMESIIRVYGPLPKGGLTSGDIGEDNKEQLA